MEQGHAGLRVRVDPVFRSPAAMPTIVQKRRLHACRILPLRLPADTTVIGMPARFATPFAKQQLRRGQNVVLLGSDVNLDVSEASERALKEIAALENRWVFTPHGFAHAFRRGKLGIVGTAGTAIQHAGCLLHRRGIGMSRIYSVGSRDLSNNIQGLETFRALRCLNEDSTTEAILLLLKRLPVRQEERLIKLLRIIEKPVVAYVPGRGNAALGRLNWAATLEDAVDLTETLFGRCDMAAPVPSKTREHLLRKSNPFSDGEPSVRGLFSGGSCCDEAVAVLRGMGLFVQSNTDPSKKPMRDLCEIFGHACIDLGAGLRPGGKPHYPMIDLRLKTELLVETSAKLRSVIILFDVFLGYGSHPRPAEELAVAIRKAQRIAGRLRHSVLFVATIIGIESDPQGLKGQTALLKKAGVILTETITEAARTAGHLAKRGS
jgi:FdrA protein